MTGRQAKAKRDAERRALVEAMERKRRRNERRRRWAFWGSGVLVVLVVAGVVTYVMTRPPAAASSALDTGHQVIPAAVTGTDTTTQQTPTKVTDDSGIDGVIAWDTAGYPAAGTASSGTVEHQHVDGPVAYTVNPPVGGPHNATWMNAGVYTKPVPTERAVHNLEHGAVWITYNPDLPKSQVDQLVAFVGKQSLIPETASSTAGQANRYMDLSPWADSSLPSPIVISAWGHQLQVTSPTDPRLQKFVDTFRNSSKYSPEYGAAVDGVPVQTGGVPAAYGSAKANPAGTAS